MSDAEPIRILYLEDSPADAELVQGLLEQEGFSFTLTRIDNPKDFLAALETGAFDIVLSDNSLPSYDGLSALTRVRGGFPEVPFIFVSGTMGEEAAIESLKAGATDYVLKDRLSRLAPAIRRALKEATAAAERRQQDIRIRELAFFDRLTGLPNRALLEDRLRMALAHAYRTHQSLAVLFLDLDRFKTVNDTLGHPVGDELLQEVAGRLSRCLRTSDTAARWGGDEFVVVLSELPLERQEAAEGVRFVMQKIRTVVAAPVTLSDQGLEPAVSIGAALYPWDGYTVTDLIQHADTAMYQAKGRERDGCRFFSEDMHELVREKLFLEHELRRAMRGSELTIHYQPQVTMQSRSIVGAEVLVRWPHPERGWIPPARFIPVAEDTGQIAAIGEWVLDQTLVQIKRWAALGLQVPRLSVNVSPLQLKDPQFPETVETLLAGHGLKPDCLALELTESAMLLEGTLGSVERLAALGLEVAVDDFGTGYSSLGLLKRFSVTKLKVDKSFVSDLGEDSNDLALVTAIIAMATSLRLEVVAEGVETELQRMLLAKLGCAAYQGFLFSPAVPPRDFQALLGC